MHARAASLSRPRGQPTNDYQPIIVIYCNVAAASQSATAVSAALRPALLASASNIAS